jgi:hypothetical protein
MIDDEAVQEDEATPDAPEATADETIEGEDAEVADQVDDITVGNLTSDTPSPQPAGTEGDPIGDAEDHIASLDMDEERQKAADLMKKL